ncbi:MAG: SBBP repeat-containing protein [Fimbriimonadaceae bacterium]|nr:SBBP repeat-containing protein [Chitinophagales bacterium]
MKKILWIAQLKTQLLALALCCTALINAQATLQWAYSFGSNDFYETDQAFDVETDEEGNVYMTGYYVDSVDFDPGPGEAFYYFSDVKKAGVLAKYSPDAELLWVVPVGDYYGQAAGYEINFDNEGNVLWTGWVLGSVDFDPGPATHLAGGSLTATSIFLAKYDSHGNYIFALAVDGNYPSSGKQIITDDDNNILIIGNFQSTIDFDPSGAEFSLTSENFYGDLFFAKYSSSGDFIFAKSISATPTSDNFDHGDYVAEDAAGNIFITGMFSGSCDFDPDAGVTELTGIAADIFFAKYDADMNLIWVKQIAGNDQKETHAIALDNDENIYIAGWYRGDMDMDASGNEYTLEHSTDLSDDIFFAKYTNAGEIVWAKTIGGYGYDYARSIAVDDEGLIYISGDFYSSVDFDPGSGVHLLEDTINHGDGFIALYDNNGNYLNASQIEGSMWNETYIMNMHLNNAGDIYITGYFSQSADFDCTNGDNILTSGGDYDFFLAKYDSIISLPVDILQLNTMQLNAYPNPASDLITINLPDDFKGNKIELFNSYGKLIYSAIVNAQHTFSIPLEDYYEGMYLLQMSGNDIIYYSKFLIAHN